MISARLSWLLVLFLAAEAFGQGRNLDIWEKSVVVIDVTRKQYDYLQPWTKRTRPSQKTGIVIGAKEILTTADELQDRTLIRLQKNGRGAWFPGKVQWVDYHANVALLTSEDAKFWDGLKPVGLAEKVTSEDPLAVVRWRSGNMELRKAEFNQFTVDESALSFAPQLQLEISSEVQGLGGSEPIISGKNLVGLNTTKGGGTLRVIPTAFFRPILEAHRKGNYRGLGYFDFVWQPSENPENLKYFKLAGEPRGVVVTSVPTNRVSEIKRHDILLQVDGFDVDIQGDYVDPEFGHLSLEYLATRKRSAGDKIKMKVWREGKEMDLQYVLPPVDFSSKLVGGDFDKEPEYLVAGGLIFQPLDVAFLKTWGEDWQRRAPFRLSYFRNEQSTPDRPSLVLLSNVLPDVYNLGYQDNRFLVVETINGQKIYTLNQVRQALQKPQDGFHKITFFKGESLQRMVLEAGKLDESTSRVLKQYGIPNPFFILDGKP